MLLLCLPLPLSLSLHVPVSAASPLSDDVSSEDCFWGKKFKDLYYKWFLKYRDSVHSKTLLFFRMRHSLSDRSECCFKNAGNSECYFHHYYSNKLPRGLTTGSLGATNITTIAVIL